MSNNVFEYKTPWDKIPPENIEEEVKNQVSKFPLADASKISLTLKCTPENFKMEIHKNINIAEAKGITNATVQEIDSNEPAKFKKAFNKIANNVVKEQKPVKLEFIQNLNESINKNNINNMNTGIANDKYKSSGNTDKKSVENQESSNLIKQDTDINKKIGNKNDKISLDDTVISENECEDNKLINDKRSLINKSTENDTKSNTTNLPTSTAKSEDANPPKESNKPYSHEEQKVNVGTNCENTTKEDLKKQKIIETIPLVKDTEYVIKEVPKEISNVGTHEKEATDDNSGCKIEATIIKGKEEIPKPHINKEEPIDVNKAEDITKLIPHEEQKMNIRTNTETNITEDSKKQENAGTIPSVKETENKDGKIVKEANKEISKEIAHEKEATEFGTGCEIEALKANGNTETPKTSHDKEEPVDINKAKDTTKPSPQEEQKITETTIKEDSKKQENIGNVPLVKDADVVKEVPKEVQEVVVHEKEATDDGTGREIEALKAKENTEAQKNPNDKEGQKDINTANDTTKPSSHEEQKITETTIKEDPKKQENIENVPLVKGAEHKDTVIVKEVPKEVQEVVVHEKEATNIGIGCEAEVSKIKENVETSKSSIDNKEPIDVNKTKDTTKPNLYEEQQINAETNKEITIKEDLKTQEDVSLVIDAEIKDENVIKETPKEIVAHEKEATNVRTGQEVETSKTQENVEAPKSSDDKEEPIDANTAKDSNNQGPNEEQKINETAFKEDSKKQDNMETVSLIKDVKNKNADKVKEVSKEIQKVVAHEKETTEFGTGCEIEALKANGNTETPKTSNDKEGPVDINKAKDTTKPSPQEEQKINETAIKEDSKKQDNMETVSLIKDVKNKNADKVKEVSKEIQKVVAHEKETTEFGTGCEIEALKANGNTETPKTSNDKEEPVDINKAKDTTKPSPQEEQKITEATIKGDFKKQENMDNDSLVKDAYKVKEVLKEIQEDAPHEKEATEFGTGCEIEALKAKENAETQKNSNDKEGQKDINTANDTTKPGFHEEQKITETTIKEDPKKQENIENVPLVKDADIVKEVPKEVQEVVVHEKEATDDGTSREIEPQKTKGNTETPKPSIDKSELAECNNKHEIKEENEKKSEKDCQIATDNESKIPSSEVKTHEEAQKILEDPTQESNSSIIDNNKETETIEKIENMEIPKSVSQQEPILSNVSDTNEKKEPEQISKSTPDETKLHNNVSEVDKGKEIPEVNTQENSATSTEVANNEIYEDSNNVPDLKTNEAYIETKTPEIKKTDGLLEAITQEDIQDIVVEEEKKEENVFTANEVQIKASADISENELEEQIKEMPKHFAKQQQYSRIPSGVDGNIAKNEKIGAESQKNHDQEGNKNTAKIPEKTIGEQTKDNAKLTDETMISPIENTKIKENQEPAKIDEKIENKAPMNVSENKTQEDSKIDNKNVDVPPKIDKINKNEESLKSNVKDDTKISSEILNEKVNNQIPEALKPMSTKEDENNESKTSKSEDTKGTLDKNVDALVKKDDAKTNKSPDNSKPKTKGTRKWSNLVNPLLSDTNEESSERTRQSLSKALPNDLLIQSDTSNSSTSDTLQSIDNTENLKINNKKKRNRKMKKSNNPNENEEKSSDLNLPLIIGLASIAIIATIIVIRRN